MWNVVKAQNRQILRDKFTHYTIIAGIAIITIMLLLNLEISSADKETLSGSQCVPVLADTLKFVLPIVLLVLISRICGWDGTDKTINYEILSGHTRREVYFGRVSISIVWGMIASILLMFLPEIPALAAGGWGVSINLTDVLFRVLLLIFVLFRLICESVLLTFMLGNCYKAMVIGLALYDAGGVAWMLISELTKAKSDTFLVYMNISRLTDFSNYSIKYIGGKDICVYDATVADGLAWNTAAVSLAAGIVCLLLGYMIFKKRDM